MSLYQCERCGCVENTACGFYWESNLDCWAEDYKGKHLCSACGPRENKLGGQTRYGKWHEKFERIFLPVGMFRTASDGNLEHIKTREQDYRKYALPKRQAELTQLLTELFISWDELRKFGKHEGDCTFMEFCSECGTPLDRCNLHSENMRMRVESMETVISNLKTYL